MGCEEVVMHRVPARCKTPPALLLSAATPNPYSQVCKEVACRARAHEREGGGLVARCEQRGGVSLSTMLLWYANRLGWCGHNGCKLASTAQHTHQMVALLHRPVIVSQRQQVPL